MLTAFPTFDAARYFNGDLASRYDQGIRLSCPGYDALHRMLVPLLQLLPQDTRFLSAGAGTGGEIRVLAERFPSWRFTGVDVSPHMLEVCRQRSVVDGIADRVRLVNTRMEDYRDPVPFDAASSIFVTHFIRDPQSKLAYLRSIAALLKPGGVLILADLFGDAGSPEFVQLMKAWLLYYVSHGANAEKLTADLRHIFDNMVFTPEAELRALLVDAGFTSGARFYQSYLFGGWVANRTAK
jgi:tRNA (cmo5U34)-methyltransferase